MPKLISTITNHFKFFAIAMLVATLFAGLGLVDLRSGESRIRIDPSVENVFANDDSTLQFYQRIRKLFGNETVLFLALVSDQELTHSDLKKVASLTHALEKMESVHHVASISNVKNILDDSDSLTIRPFFDASSNNNPSIDAIQADLQQNPLYKDVLLTKDNMATALLVHFHEISSKTFREQAIFDQIRKTADEHRGSLRLLMAGELYFEMSYAEILEKNLRKTIPFIFVFGLLILFFGFRRMRAVLPVLAISAIALLWLLGSMGWTNTSLDAATVIAPPIVIIVGLAYSIYFISEYFALANCEKSQSQWNHLTIIQKTLQESAGPILLAGATTAASFLALSLSPLIPVKRLAWICIFGIGCDLALTLIGLPCFLLLLKQAPSPTQSNSRNYTWITDRISALHHTHRKAIIALWLIILIFFAFGIQNLEISNRFIRSFAESHPIRMEYTEIERIFGSSNAIYIVLESENKDAFADPNNLKELADLEAWLQEQPEVGSTASLVDYLALLQKGFGIENSSKDGMPANPRLVKQLLFLGGSDELDTLVNADLSTASIVTRVSLSDAKRLKHFLERVNRRLESVPRTLSAQATGQFILLIHGSDLISLSLFRGLLTAMVIIFFILLWLFRSFPIALLALLPNGIPLLAYFGTAGFFGILVDQLTCTAGCITLGIVVDDTIHFIARFRNHQKAGLNAELAAKTALENVFIPVSFTSLALIGGFLTFTLGELTQQIDAGLLAAFTLALAWLADITLTPALLASAPEKQEGS